MGLPAEKLEEEIWIPIPGFEGCYEVSSEGRVRSLGRILRDGKPFTGRVLKPGIKKGGKKGNGYAVVVLSVDGLHHTKYAHRLVMKAFCLSDRADVEVNHRNGKKHDNRLSNLEWVTRGENMIHAYANGLRNIKGGSRHGIAC